MPKIPKVHYTPPGYSPLCLYTVKPSIRAGTALYQPQPPLLFACLPCECLWALGRVQNWLCLLPQCSRAMPPVYWCCSLHLTQAPFPFPPPSHFAPITWRQHCSHIAACYLHVQIGKTQAHTENNLPRQLQKKITKRLCCRLQVFRRLIWLYLTNIKV